MICDTFQYAYEKDTKIIEPEVNNDFIGLAETIHFNQDDQSQLSMHCEQDLFSFIELDLYFEFRFIIINRDNPMNTYQKCVQSVNTEYFSDLSFSIEIGHLNHPF